MIRSTFSAALLFLAAIPVCADDLKTLAGKTVPGTLEKITDSDIVLSGAATPINQALELSLRPGRTLPTADKYIEVHLADESVLRCTKITFTGKEATLTLTTGAAVKTPLSGVLTVLRDAQETKLKDQWARLSKGKTRRADRIFLLRDGDLNPIDGAFGAIDEAKQTIKFKPETVGAPEIEPALDKLQGMQFARTDAAVENTLCKVIDTDGNLVVASKINYDAGLFTVTTPFGQKINLDGKLVARLDFNFGRLTYLSDLQEKMTASPFLGGFNPLRKNLSLNGEPIVVGDKQYAKGLSCYAGADFSYDLAGKYKKLNAILCVDLRVAEEGQGKVTVSIYADRDKKFSQEVSTKTALPINVDVRDVNSLRIVVSGPDFLPYHGHAMLANAHVSQ